MTYLFDANTFIEAARLYYRFDVAPGYWDWLVSEPMRNLIGSVQHIKEEIGKGTGDLVTWADSAPEGFWIPVTAATLDEGIELAGWAADPARQYTQAAVDEFLAGADFWLIAEAMASGATVVTREVSAPESKKSIKIPDACKAFGVACAQPFPVYATLGLRLS